MGANCSNMTYSDENISEFVFQTMGPRCLTPTVAAVTLVLYSVILFLGFFGNFITVLVIVRNSSMHTATNYYLLNLALADMLSLILGLPFELRSSMTTMYPDIMPEYVCKLRSFVTEMTSYASVLTVTAFSIERWLAICFPLKMKMFSKLNRAVKVIISIWILSFSSALPMLKFTVMNRIPLPYEPFMNQNHNSSKPYYALDLTDDGRTVKHTDFCALQHDNILAQKALINFTFWTFFLIPLIIISALYVHIIYTINQAMRQATVRIKRHYSKKLERRKTVINMLVAVVVTFFLCWLPYHVQRMSTLYVDMFNVGPQLMQFFSVLFFVTGYFYYANSAINPILYSVLNRKFREAFLHTLKCYVRKNSNQFTGGSTRLLPNSQMSSKRHIMMLTRNVGTYGGINLDSPVHKQTSQWSLWTKNYSSD